MKIHSAVSLLAAAFASTVLSVYGQQPDGISAPDPLVSHIDTTVRPGDDFFLYANGKWFKENPIPPSEQSNGLWQLIQDTINAQIRNICESSSALANVEKGSNKQKIGDFFFSGMDSAALNRKGLADLKSDLDRIDAVSDLKGVMQAVSYIQSVSGSPLFFFAVGQDDKMSSKNAVFIYQGGLSLPDRRFYFDADDRAMKIRQKFVEHLHNTFVLLGYDDGAAKQAAEHLMKLETSIAQTSRKREDTRDPEKNYNKMSFKQLTGLTPELDWTTYLQGTGLRNVDTVIVGQPEFLGALNGYMTSFPLSDWKNYLKYHLVRGLASYVDDKTFHEMFSFYSTTLRGVPEPKPRWKRAVEQTDRSLGELIGQVYVDEYLPKGTKEKLLEIGMAIKDVYAQRISALDWMSDATKVKALKKLSTIIMKVGYPDKWKDMSSLEIDRSSYVHNVKNANRWRFNYMISKYGKPVDRTEWDMEPQTYNAYYNPSNNEIVVPGCNIIVPGYERKLADDALLYSIIGGSTFGHEITHGFDDQGRKSDGSGNLRDWWTAPVAAEFERRAACIARQFDGYAATEDQRVDGRLTLGENIADLGGVTLAWNAYQASRQGKPAEAPVGGFSAAQQFFLAHAQAWCQLIRPENARLRVVTDPHSPARWRVDGPLSNLPAFQEAFGCQAGDRMVRAERCQIW